MTAEPIIAQTADSRIGMVVGFVAHHTHAFAVLKIGRKLESHPLQSLTVMESPVGRE